MKDLPCATCEDRDCILCDVPAKNTHAAMNKKIDDIKKMLLEYKANTEKLLLKIDKILKEMET